MRRAAMRAVVGGALGVVVLAGGLSGCVTTSGRGYSEELPSHRMTGMEPSGTVARVDEMHNVIVLDNGQMYRVSADNAVYVDGRPVTFRTVRPGSRVTIVSGTPVVYQNGQYVVVQPGTTGAVAPGGVLASPPPTAVVTPAPPVAVVTAPSASVASVPATGSTVRMYGRVADVESNGNVKVRLPDGNAFEFRPPAGTVVRKGDAVTMDFLFGAIPAR